MVIGIFLMGLVPLAARLLPFGIAPSAEKLSPSVILACTSVR